MAKREYRFLGRAFFSLRVVGLVLSIMVLVAVGSLAGLRHGWRLGLLRCAAVDGGYLCGADNRDMLVFAPGYHEGRTLLGPDVGWLSLMSALAGLEMGVVDAPAASLLQATRAFIDEFDADAAVGFSLGGRATLALAEEGAVERAAVVCTPTDLAGVIARFSALTGRLADAGVSGPDPRLRSNFDAWRAVYDAETLPQIQALDRAMVDSWLTELDMTWTDEWERYLAIRSAFWLDERGEELPVGGDTLPALTGQLEADLLQMHNQLDPVVPISEMHDYQRLAVDAGAGDRISVRVIQGFGHCQLGPADWLYLMRWLRKEVKN